MTNYWKKTENQSPFIREYKVFQSLSKRLCQKILEQYTDETNLRIVSKLMGINQGKTLVFESDEEINFFMDFYLHEYQVDGNTFMQKYQAEVSDIDPKEDEIIEAHLTSYTSLFKVIEVNPKDINLTLSDVLNPPQTVKVWNINLSQTAQPGFLIFTRVLPFKDFNTLSGMFAAFPKGSERALLKRYKVMKKRVNSTNESVQRFIAFFKLNRTLGLEAKTVDI